MRVQENIDALLDQRSSVQRELNKATNRAWIIQQKMCLKPILWFEQDELNWLIKKAQKLKNHLFGIDKRLKSVQKVAA